jgi:hypothetical protein
MTDISIVNRSTVVTDAGIATLLPALQTQISRDFAPFWGTGTTLHFVGSGQPDPGHWRCLVLDHSDQAGDLGYHIDNNGVPEARIFAAEDMKDGSLLSVTVSHELLEMLADPTANRVFQIGTTTYIVEVADPVEADDDGYDIDGVRVSNFATPRYFGMTNPGNDPRFDFRWLLTAGIPTLRPGGYVMFDSGGVWHSTMARHADGSLGCRALRSGRSHYRASLPH